MNIRNKANTSNNPFDFIRQYQEDEIKRKQREQDKITASNDGQISLAKRTLNSLLRGIGIETDINKFYTAPIRHDATGRVVSFYEGDRKYQDDDQDGVAVVATIVPCDGDAVHFEIHMMKNAGGLLQDAFKCVGNVYHVELYILHHKKPGYQNVSISLDSWVKERPLIYNLDDVLGVIAKIIL